MVLVLTVQRDPYWRLPRHPDTLNFSRALPFWSGTYHWETGLISWYCSERVNIVTGATYTPCRSSHGWADSLHINPTFAYNYFSSLSSFLPWPQVVVFLLARANWQLGEALHD